MIHTTKKALNAPTAPLRTKNSVLKLVLPAIFIVAGVFLPQVVDGVLFTDGFETCETGQYLQNAGCDWGSSNNKFLVIEDYEFFECVEGIKCAFGEGKTDSRAKRGGDTGHATGTFGFWFMYENEGAGWLGSWYLYQGAYTDYITIVRIDGNNIRFYKSGLTYETIFEDVSENVWHYFKMEWKDGNQMRFNLDGVQLDWKTTSHSRATLRYFEMRTGTAVSGENGYMVLDYLDETPEMLPELRVQGLSPASGSTLTDVNAYFTIGWEEWDFNDIWKDFVFSFRERTTGVISGIVAFTPTTTAGEVVYQFSDFNIDRNAIYDFTARARSYLYEWTAYYTSDLVEPEYYVIFDVDGWLPMFKMPVFETWYGENVDRFATPTAIFTGIVGFISPIFDKIGEFGNMALGFLDTAEAYDTGYDLGKVIPLFRHYVAEIEVFFGGFPVIQIFLAFMVLLIGIFIFRLILKFIPGLG